MDLKCLFLTLTILSIKLQYLKGAAKQPNPECWKKSSKTKEIYKPKPNLDNSTICATYEKEAKECCVFPFKYKNETYTECTTARANENITGFGIRDTLGLDQWAWCAVEINPATTVMTKWNHCGPSCPGFIDFSSNNWKTYVLAAVFVLLIAGIVFCIRKKCRKN